MFWVFAFFIVSLSYGAVVPPDGVTVEAERTVDITTQVVKISTNYIIINNGKSQVTSFMHVVGENENDRLSFISASEEGKEGKLKVKEVPTKDLKEGFVGYQIDLPHAITPGSKHSVHVEYMLTEYLVPLPAKIKMSDHQYIMFTGNAHVACFYPVAKETTVFVLPAGKLLSRSKIAPSKSENGKIIYGPYENVQPFTVATTKIHTESNAPFLVATKIERTLMLSLWGSISVEENIFVVHKGAELTGPFSRLDFQLDQRGRNRPVVTEYKTLLPSTAKNIYYRDEIGNISTSSVRTQRDAVEVTIQPRFPLFGGWKTEYTIGYDVPAYQYLFSSGNSFVLKMRVMDHLFDNVVVDHLSLKIILPEGSKNFKLVTPYTMKRKPDELHFTYLDTSGRPTIVVEKDNLVDAHIQSFTLNFEFDRIQLWRKPMTAVVAFAVLFVFVVIVVRFDFTIVADPAAETRLQAQSQIEEIVDLHATRLRLFDQLTDIANKYKSNKDTSAFTTARKKAENELSQITKSVDSLKTSLKTTSADLAERLNEVQKLSKTAADHVTNYLTQVERFVRGQIQKAVFTESERMFHQKLNEAKEKMDNIVYSL